MQCTGVPSSPQKQNPEGSRVHRGARSGHRTQSSSWNRNQASGQGEPALPRPPGEWQRNIHTAPSESSQHLTPDAVSESAVNQCPSHNCYSPRGVLGSQLGGPRRPSSPCPSLVTICGLCPAPIAPFLGTRAPITNGQRHQEPQSSLPDFCPTGPRRQGRGRTAKRH